MKKLLFTIALAVFAVTAFAQQFEGYDESQGTYERITERGPYLTNKFFDNWFIGVAGGVNLYTGSKDHEGDFSDRLAPALDVSLGKWVTPSVGMRLQYSGLQAKGWSPVPTRYTDATADSDGLYKKKFNYVSFHADVLWNISNGIGGYKETRTWSFVPFAGFGFVRAEKHGREDYEFAANAGLLNIIRLGEVVDLTLEGRYMITKASFDQFTNNKKVDGMVSVTAGLSFKLGPRGGFKRPIAAIPANYTPYQQRISSLEDELSGANSRIDRLTRQLDECNSRPQPKPETITAPIGMTVFFNIGRYNLDEGDMLNLEAIANTIKSTPNKTYSVTGYADSSTGTPQRNETLSRQRADAVKDALVTKFGVNASQLNVTHKGGVANHRNPELDRAVKIE